MIKCILSSLLEMNSYLAIRKAYQPIVSVENTVARYAKSTPSSEYSRGWGVIVPKQYVIVLPKQILFFTASSSSFMENYRFLQFGIIRYEHYAYLVFHNCIELGLIYVYLQNPRHIAWRGNFIYAHTLQTFLF